MCSKYDPVFVFGNKNGRIVSTISVTDQRLRSPGTVGGISETDSQHHGISVINVRQLRHAQTAFSGKFGNAPGKGHVVVDNVHRSFVSFIFKPV